FTEKINDVYNQSITFNADIDNGRILALDDVFQMNDDTIQTIRGLAKETMNDDVISEEELDDKLAIPEEWDWDIDRHAFTLYIDTPANSEQTDFQIDIPIDTLYLIF